MGISLKQPQSFKENHALDKDHKVYGYQWLFSNILLLTDNSLYLSVFVCLCLSLARLRACSHSLSCSLSLLPCMHIIIQQHKHISLSIHNKQSVPQTETITKIKLVVHICVKSLYNVHREKMFFKICQLFTK